MCTPRRARRVAAADCSAWTVGVSQFAAASASSTVRGPDPEAAAALNETARRPSAASCADRTFRGSLVGGAGVPLSCRPLSHAAQSGRGTCSRLASYRR